MCAHHPLFHSIKICLYKLGVYLALHQKKHHQVKGNDSSPLLHPHEIPPASSSEAPAQERQEPVGVGPEETTKVPETLAQGCRYGIMLLSVGSTRGL